MSDLLSRLVEVVGEHGEEVQVSAEYMYAQDVCEHGDMRAQHKCLGRIAVGVSSYLHLFHCGNPISNSEWMQKLTNPTTEKSP